MNKKETNIEIKKEQEKLNELYQQFGEKVFKEMRDRDESRPAEEFFNSLMFSSMEFCVKISSSIKLIENMNKPAEPEAEDIGATQVIIPQEDQTQVIIPQESQTQVIIPQEDQTQVIIPQENVTEPAFVPAAQPKKTCPRCGADCDADVRFCTSCGFQWPSATAKSEPVVMPVVNNDKPLFCTNCGSKLDSDSLFCISCGQRVE